MLMKMTPPWVPELLPEVQDRITSILSTATRPIKVLELGAGWSTVWFSLMRGVNLISFETDHTWWVEVTDTLERLGLEAGGVWFVEPLEMCPLIGDFPDNGFDLVMVDCLDEMRRPCLHRVQPKVRPGGVVVVDDSHWPMWNEPYTIPNWPCEIIKEQHVHHTGIEHFHQTSIFTKPL